MVVNPIDGTLPIKKFVVGNYGGDDEETKYINLGFTPKAVLVVDSAGRTGYQTGSYPVICGGLALWDDRPVQGNAVAIELLDGGFAVHKPSGNGYIRTNEAGGNYYYIAFA